MSIFPDVDSQNLVFWITGLSGAGKTTVATCLVEGMRAAGRPPVLLDGDRLREVLGRVGAHDAAARRELAMTYARLCREIAVQGFDVVCATISMFDEVRGWNRQNLPGYREIYLRVPMAELMRRDPKGIYARQRSAVESWVAGVDLAVELPTAPDLVIDNHGPVAAPAAAALILERFVTGQRPS